MTSTNKTFDSNGRSYDSGMSSVNNYFNSFLPELHRHTKSSFEECIDPTLDFNDDGDLEMAIRAPSPIRHPTQIRQSTPNKRTLTVAQRNMNAIVEDPSGPNMDEIQIVLEQFQKKTSYATKLAKVMNKHLEKTLGPVAFNMFLEDKLPQHWVPLVKFNEDNTPYVEFLVKSDVSDEHPSNQLVGCQPQYLLYCFDIVKSLPAFVLDSDFSPQHRSRSIQSTKGHNVTNQHKQQPVARPKPQQQQQQQPKPQQQPTVKSSSSSTIQSRKSLDTFTKEPETRSPPQQQPSLQQKILQRAKRPAKKDEMEDELLLPKRTPPSRACKRDVANISYKE